jgi:hypothetical protein
MTFLISSQFFFYLDGGLAVAVGKVKHYKNRVIKK